MKMQWLSALVLGALSCAAFAEEAPADSNLIKQGEYLARAGDCVACHTNGKAGKPFAGGLPMETPIGTIYSTNITPDKEHGIGGYTFEEFDDAVRKGVRKDGSTLYPAMPYPSFARISEADMRAMYAYFMHGVEPVNVANKDTDIPWPLAMAVMSSSERYCRLCSTTSLMPPKTTDLSLRPVLRNSASSASLQVPRPSRFSPRRLEATQPSIGALLPAR